LQGLNKKDMAEEYGEEQVHQWRRSYSVRPPQLDESDKRFPSNERKYQDLLKDELPAGESLEDTVKRVLPFWNEQIAPIIKSGKQIVIAAHGNSLRALVKHLEKISDEEIPSIEIPTGKPLVYKLDANLLHRNHYYLE
jgi:2,3-bisphosphoglycerate-dependent phosphoglycerate mutase